MAYYIKNDDAKKTNNTGRVELSEKDKEQNRKALSKVLGAVIVVVVVLIIGFARGAFN